MSDQQPAIPPAKGGVVAYLNLEGAAKAAEFYVKAFGAKLVFMQPVDEKGRTMHAHLDFNGTSLMVSDFYAEHGHPPVKPQGFNLLIPSKAIDADYQHAVDAGCTATMPPQDMFWGDRYGQLKDPFGVTWAMNQTKA
jgi:PhnB protein